MNCRKCKDECEKVIRGGEFAFHFCRKCKIPYDSTGSAMFNSASQLVSHFNPLAAARRVIGSTHKDASSVARTAFEVLLIQSMQEAYMSGLKDGALLAYSQDVGHSEPVL